MSLLEGIAGIGILSIAAAAALAATLASSRVVNSPPPRDHALVAAHNAAVEARAVAAYDASAAAAILAAPPASWSANGATLQSSVDAGTLVLVATQGNETARVRFPVTREALPQGAIVDMSGNILPP